MLPEGGAVSFALRQGGSTVHQGFFEGPKISIVLDVSAREALWSEAHGLAWLKSQMPSYLFLNI